MAGRYLLDTNIVIALFPRDAGVVDRLGQAGEVFIPSIVLGELHYDARRSGRVEENVARVLELATRSEVVGCDGETAVRYGKIETRLRTKGKRLPENDIWNAAIAMQHGLTVVTRDAHFAEVDTLVVESW